MKISLIICAYNEELYIKECLESVIQNPPGAFHEIIVVDNASTDRTAEIAKRFSGVRVVYEAHKGLTKARERGLKEANGDLVAYIDADTRLPVDWIKKVTEKFNHNKKLVCLSGPYRYYDGSQWKNKIMHTIWWLTAPLTYRIVGYMVLGGNFVAKKKSLLAMGGFDQSIDFYGEDTDIARRLSTYGKVLFDMNFFIYSSSRRFSKEGLIRTNIIYALNFLWPILFHRPFSNTSTDIRQVGTKKTFLNNFSPRIKTNVTITFFTFVGILGAHISVHNLKVTLPLLIFYVVITLNTYFSMKLFTRIVGRHTFIQDVADIVLVILYALLAFNFDKSYIFIELVTLLFIAATLKYVLLIGKLPYPKLLKKKICIDILGIVMGLITCAIAYTGHPFIAAWFLAIIFTVANIYLLFIRPMYSLKD